MALSLIHTVPLDLSVQEGTSSYSAPPYKLDPPRNVYCFCCLTMVNSPGGFGGFGNAQVEITEFVQSGTTVPNNSPDINQPNVSSITFTLTVSDGWAHAIGVILDQGT